MINVHDTQAALGFLVHQRSHLEAEVLKKEFPEILYPRAIPVDTSADNFAPSVTFFSQTPVGQAKMINSSADDIPYINMLENKFEQTVSDAGIGYQFSVSELGSALAYGRDLSSDGAMFARETAEIRIDEWAFSGHAPMSVEGLFNTTGITIVASPATFATMTPQAIIDFVNGQIGAIKEETLGIDTPDTLALPISVFSSLAGRQIAPESSLTILEQLRTVNAYTQATGKPLVIYSSHRLTDRIVMYRRSPSCLKMHVPLPPVMFLDPQPMNLMINVPGMFRVAPLSIRRPSSIRYFDGVA